jgi:hypothetical protein
VVGNVITDEVAPRREGEEFKPTALTVRVEGQPAKLSNYGRLLTIAPEILVNQDLPAIISTARWLGASFCRVEFGALLELLTSNPTLGDGHPVFDTAWGNDLQFPVLDENSMSATVAAMRLQPVGYGSEIKLNAPPACVFVHPKMETDTRSGLYDLRLESMIEVLPHSSIPENTTYWLTNPAAAPVLGLGIAEGSDGLPRVEVNEHFRGAQTMIRTDFWFGAQILGRTGIVRSSKS